MEQIQVELKLLPLVIAKIRQGALSGTLICRHAQEEGGILFQDGQLVDAFTNENNCDPALYEILAWPEGQLSFQKEEYKGRETIDAEQVSSFYQTLVLLQKRGSFSTEGEVPAAFFQNRQLKEELWSSAKDTDLPSMPPGTPVRTLAVEDLPAALGEIDDPNFTGCLYAFSLDPTAWQWGILILSEGLPIDAFYKDLTILYRGQEAYDLLLRAGVASYAIYQVEPNLLEPFRALLNVQPRYKNIPAGSKMVEAALKEFAGSGRSGALYFHSPELTTSIYYLLSKGFFLTQGYLTDRHLTLTNSPFNLPTAEGVTFDILLTPPSLYENSTTTPPTYTAGIQTILREAVEALYVPLRDIAGVEGLENALLTIVHQGEERFPALTKLALGDKAPNNSNNLSSDDFSQAADFLFDAIRVQYSQKLGKDVFSTLAQRSLAPYLEKLKALGLQATIVKEYLNASAPSNAIPAQQSRPKREITAPFRRPSGPLPEARDDDNPFDF